jgi:hypothetical protein
LVTAVDIGAADVVDYLLDHGASVDGGAFDGDSTALHVAVHRERHDLVRRLLAAGADPAAVDAHGRTAAEWGTLKAARRPDHERRRLPLDPDPSHRPLRAAAAKVRWCTSHPRTDLARCAPSSASSTLSHPRAGG